MMKVADCPSPRQGLERQLAAAVARDGHNTGATTGAPGVVLTEPANAVATIAESPAAGIN